MDRRGNQYSTLESILALMNFLPRYNRWLTNKEKDPKTQTTTYTYNNMDRVAMRKNPLLKTESYLYDGNGNLTKLTDRKAQITNYTYDVLDRRTKTTFHDNTSTTYTYDAGNRLTQIQEKNAAGTVTVSRPPVRRALQCRFADRFPSERASAPHRDLISSPV